MAKKLIPVVAYLRKSTRGKKKDGTERQEKSIPGQRMEIQKYAKAHGYEIVREYADDGVSGWKLDAKRPEFSRMIQEARAGGVQAVLCDDIDRFSRADAMQVFADVQALKTAGVKTLALVNQGKYDLSELPIDKVIMLSVQANGSHEFSKRLGRRLAIARCNKAKEGKRSGGMAPYGYKNEKGGGLVEDPATSPIVVKIFEQCLSGARGLRSIANDLNEAGIPSPRGGKWSRETIKVILTNQAYCGAFVFNRKQSGEFYFIDDAHDVKPAAERTRKKWEKSDAAAIIKHDAHPALVSVEMFDKVQETLKKRSQTTQRLRTDGYALTGTLFCGHCGSPLYGQVKVERGVRTYVCGSSNRMGNSVCHSYSVREDEILPFILTTLKSILGEARMAAMKPMKKKPFQEVTGQLDRLRRRHDELNSMIEKGMPRLLLEEDDQLRKMMKEHIKEWQAEQKKLAEEIEAANMPHDLPTMKLVVTGYINWLQDHEDRLSEIIRQLMPPAPTHVHSTNYIVMSNPSTKPSWDVPKLRQQLEELGTRVELFWEPQQWGKRTIYRLASDNRCRLKMGEFEGPFPTQPSRQVKTNSSH